MDSDWIHDTQLVSDAVTQKQRVYWDIAQCYVFAWSEFKDQTCSSILLPWKWFHYELRKIKIFKKTKDNVIMSKCQSCANYSLCNGTQGRRQTRGTAAEACALTPVRYQHTGQPRSSLMTSLLTSSPSRPKHSATACVASFLRPTAARYVGWSYVCLHWLTNLTIPRYIT